MALESLSLTRYITASGHTACVMHNAVPTSADLHLVGTTNLKKVIIGPGSRLQKLFGVWYQTLNFK